MKIMMMLMLVLSLVGGTNQKAENYENKDRAKVVSVHNIAETVTLSFIDNDGVIHEDYYFTGRDMKWFEWNEKKPNKDTVRLIWVSHAPGHEW